MQVCECLVLIGGDIGNSVTKQDVTAAEIAVLRAIHGNDAVRSIVIKDQIKVDHDNERERLALIYKDEIVMNLFGKFGDLPETLEAARVESDMIVSDETKKSKTKKVAEAAEPTVQPSGE
jgi:hypothetical protein